RDITSSVRFNGLVKRSRCGVFLDATVRRNSASAPGIYGVMMLGSVGRWRPFVMAAVIALALPFAASSSVLAAPTYAQLVGQKLMVAMGGTTPSSDLLGRIGRGEVGGVILFGSNITSAGAAR